MIAVARVVVGEALVARGLLVVGEASVVVVATESSSIVVATASTTVHAARPGILVVGIAAADVNVLVVGIDAFLTKNIENQFEVIFSNVHF